MTVKGRLLHFWYEFDFLYILPQWVFLFFILMQSIRNGRYSSI